MSSNDLCHVRCYTSYVSVATHLTLVGYAFVATHLMLTGYGLVQLSG
jgi:hypothetical protein